MYPKIIQNLINQFSKLPSVGPKTAERLVFHLLYQPQSALIDFGEAIEHLKENIKICQVCYNFSENSPCHICSDPRRNSKLICVVAKPQDQAALEKSSAFSGLYHILGGCLNPAKSIGPESLKTRELIVRAKKEGVEEILLALNSDMDGETTSLYLTKMIRQNCPEIKISRLARGLPMGADLEYADEVTLENAISSRQTIN
jgi:recombination protein RecR